jgi:hypothetical protein
MGFDRDDDGTPDPAFAPLSEAGQGEAEGFELAEQELVEHATHSDGHSDTEILLDADPRDEELLDEEYGEADSEFRPDA